MSLTTSEMTPADIAAVTNNNRCNNGCNDGWGGGWSSWIILFLIFGMFGWGGFGGFGGGWGGNNAGVQGALTRGELCQDMNFSQLENGVRGIQQGLCDGFYAQNTNTLTGFGNLTLTNAQNTAQLQNSMNQGFSGLNTGLVTQGYETRLASQAFGAQLSDCCCGLKGEIKDVNTQSIMNTSAIQQDIQRCCCENEKIAMQSRFDAAQNNCATLQAIDKVGDRIIDYMAAQNVQNLRDENQALRLAASQQAQNNYLISQINPRPYPSYSVPNPFCYNSNNGYGYNGNCGGCACA
ncbi:MAG: hypothetical protein K2I82_06460 [Ruminococcus sp.]|nr:hypothetical protein [Ruminococcus sp.]